MHTGLELLEVTKRAVDTTKKPALTDRPGNEYMNVSMVDNPSNKKQSCITQKHRHHATKMLWHTRPWALPSPGPVVMKEHQERTNCHTHKNFFHDTDVILSVGFYI